MAFGQGILPSRGSVCRRCVLTAGALARGRVFVQKRSIGLKYLAKEEAAAQAWAERAERIRKGLEKNTFDLLEERGYVKDLAG